MPSREREAKEYYSAKHVGEDMILEKSPYIWGTMMMSSESETKHSVNLFQNYYTHKVLSNINCCFQPPIFISCLNKCITQLAQIDLICFMFLGQD